jgi:hypothetical protein
MALMLMIRLDLHDVLQLHCQLANNTTKPIKTTTKQVQLEVQQSSTLYK